MEGTELLILQACNCLAADEYGFVLDVDLARHTRILITDVRDCLESLEQNGFISLVRLENPDGLKAKVEAKGRTELSKRRPFQEEPKEKQGQANPVKVVPRGLRSFIAEDKDFFLELLPDHRATDGLPESVHFWKTRIEETHADRTFRIGLIHGPSGCGKSSLVRAGLIPNLAAHVRYVYVEATPDDTEAGLLTELRNKCPELGRIRTLTNFLSALRRGQAIPADQKVVIVLDQFEQWLHAKSGIENTELVDAVKKCDGGHVQTIVLVRDDFWTAVTRFSTQIRVKFDRDSNSYFVDLFHQPHGEKVITAFGQYYGRVDNPLTSDQQEFIKRAIKALALRGMILPLRLALFTLVFQGREWTTQTLKDIGGVENIEVEFFKKIFDFVYSERRYRDHREAAQSVLGALLPKDDSEIKTPRPVRELLEVSGYAGQPEKFEELLRILDKDLFLITPSEQGKVLNADGGHASGPSDRFYQLTHDFLVPPLREWRNKDQEASQLFEAIRMAETKNVPQLVEKLTRLRSWANPLLHRVIENLGEDTKERLHFSLALLPVDAGQVNYLLERLLKADPDVFPVIRDALKPHREELVERLWSVLEQSKKGQYLQAASALALYAPSSARWQTVGGKVARAMVRVSAAYLGDWLNALRPARDKLTAHLAIIYRDTERPETERKLAFDVLQDYASDQPNVLANMQMDSEEKDFADLFEKLKAHQEAVVPLLEEEMVKSLPEATEVEKDGLAKRQARAAVALIRMDKAEEVWSLLRHSADPRLRSFIVNWLSPLGADPKLIVAELDRIDLNAKPTLAQGQQAMDAILFHPETSMRRALILVLGQFGEERLSAEDRKPLIDNLLALYQNDPDAGIHGAAEWTLRKWGQQESLKEKDAAMRGKEPGEHRWYVNGQGQTFAVIDGPIEFDMGSPPTDLECFDFDDELLHKRVIPRRFAIATKEVTVEQYKRFQQARPVNNDAAENELKKFSPDLSGPMIVVTWYRAAVYCNWLSKQERIPKEEWCYIPNKKGRYDEGMRIPEDMLVRKGYRLPTEAEWEYACRAGARTSRYYGASMDLLGRYAWYLTTSQNRASPCGNLLPNDLGLFDMLGNVLEWVQDGHKSYQPDQSGQIYESITHKHPRILRGGSFFYRPALVRSAFRDGVAPSNRYSDGGFRLARTYP